MTTETSSVEAVKPAPPVKASPPVKKKTTTNKTVPGSASQDTLVVDLTLDQALALAQRHKEPTPDPERAQRAAIDLVNNKRTPIRTKLERSPESSSLKRQPLKRVYEGSKSVKKPPINNVIMSELDSEIDRIDKELLRQENNNLKQAKLAKYTKGVKLPTISPDKQRSRQPVTQKPEEELYKLLSDQKNYNRLVSVYNQESGDLGGLANLAKQKATKPKSSLKTIQYRYSGAINADDGSGVDPWLPRVYSQVRAPRIGYKESYQSVLDTQNRNMLKQLKMNRRSIEQMADNMRSKSDYD